MRKNDRSVIWFAPGLTALFLLLTGPTGGVSAAPERDGAKDAQNPPPVQSVWPLPPDPPRIRWLDQISKFAEFEGKEKKKKRSWFEMAAGTPVQDTEEKKQLVSPYGVTVDSHSRIFVADWAAGGVVVFDREARHVEVWGAGKGVPLRRPIGVAVDDQNRLFVSDAVLHAIFCLSSKGELLAQFGQNQLGRPAGLAIDKNRSLLYVADVSAHRVLVFSTENFALVKTIGGPQPGSEPGFFRSPNSVAVDHRGFLYVVDTFNYRVQIFDRLWRFVNAFGSQGDSPGEFSRPKGIAIDSEGHIYVADAEYNNFQIFDSKGRALLFVGTQGTRPGQFTLIAGLFIDEHDRIYTTEQRVVPRIQVFQYRPQPGSKE